MPTHRLAAPLLPVLLALLAGCGGSTSPPTSSDLVRIQTTSLPEGATGEPYDATVVATGPHPPLWHRVVAGALPPGLTLDAQDGRLHGWPRQVGRYDVTIEVRDGVDRAVARDVAFAASSRSYTLTVRRGPLRVLPFPLPPALVHAGYQHRFEAVGGTAPYGPFFAADPVPDGLTLHADGRLVGSPTGPPGRPTLEVGVTDASGGAATHAFALDVVVLPLGIAKDPWPDAAAGFPYRATPAVSPVGGGAPYVWSLRDGDVLPTGLSLDAGTGRVEGSTHDVGVFPFTLEVRDRVGQRAARDVSMRVNPGPVLHRVEPGVARRDGSPVSLRGSGFQPGMTVSFAGGPELPTTFVDATEARALPPTAPLSGPVLVRVTNPDGGRDARPGAFRYPLATVAFDRLGVVGAPGSLGSSRAVAAGDLDGDGRDDLVQVFSAGIQVVRAPAPGAGDAWTAQRVRSSGSFNDVRLADLDADGDLDLVVLRSGGTETLEVYLNDGRGGFPPTATTSTTYPKPPSHFPSSLAVGDVDGDGVPDLAFTSGGGGQGTLFVYRGLGKGLFSLVHQATGTLHDGRLGCYAPNMVALCDLDGDGRDDFVLVDAYPSVCAAGQSCPATAGADNVFPGARDLVAWVSLAGATGAPLAWRPVVLSGNDGYLDGDNLCCVAYDHDGDGVTDVAVLGGFRDQRGMGVSFLKGDGTGRLVERHTRPTAFNRRYGASLDADLDGCMDLVVVGSDGRKGSFGAAGYSVAELFLGGPAAVPTLAWRSGPEFAASLPGANPGRVAVGDFDGDGLPDFAVDQSFQTKQRFSNDQDDGEVEGVAVFLNRSR